MSVADYGLVHGLQELFVDAGLTQSEFLLRYQRSSFNLLTACSPLVLLVGLVHRNLWHPNRRIREKARKITPLEAYVREEQSLGGGLAGSYGIGAYKRNFEDMLEDDPPVRLCPVALFVESADGSCLATLDSF